MNFDFVKELWPSILKYLLLMLLFILLPVKSLLSTNLLVLSWALVFQLRQDIMTSIKPLPKEWFSLCLKTLIVTNIFLGLYWLAGIFGLIGLLLLSLALGVYRIYVGRDLFNSFTTWAADRLWGRTKEDFKIKKKNDKITWEELGIRKVEP